MGWIDASDAPAGVLEAGDFVVATVVAACTRRTLDPHRAAARAICAAYKWVLECTPRGLD